MGVMDKFLNYMKLNDEDDDYYDDGYLDDEEPDEAPAPRRSQPSKSAARERDEEQDEAPAPRRVSHPAPASKVTPMRQGGRKAPSGGMEVCVIKPTTVEDAREITETLLGNRTVVMNLEGLDVDIAQRILDFTSGSCYAIGGNLQKISLYIFIITPASVDISGDFQEILGNFDSGSLNGSL